MSISEMHMSILQTDLLYDHTSVVVTRIPASLYLTASVQLGIEPFTGTLRISGLLSDRGFLKSAGILDLTVCLQICIKQ